MYPTMPLPRSNITVFQALIRLVEAYRSDPNNQEKYEQVIALLLPGIRSQEDADILNDLLEAPILDKYNVVLTPKAINEDPVRRNFETRLAGHTLREPLDGLDFNLLRQHLEAIKEIAEPRSDSGKTTPGDEFDEREDKINLLESTVILLKKAAKHMLTQETLLTLHSQEGSMYDPEHRGRAKKTDRTYSVARGIMKSTMPLIRHDDLSANSHAVRSRVADTWTYTSTVATMPHYIFSNLVTPFVGSISGVMLLQLGILAELLKEDRCVYKSSGEDAVINIGQLKAFFRSFIAFGLSDVGWNSLEEFFSVFQLPEVQDEFDLLLPNILPLFTMDNMFRVDNNQAFNAALSETVEYNNQILGMNEMHGELKLRAKHAGSITLDLPHKRVGYTFFSSSASDNRMLARCTHSFSGIQRCMKQYPGVLERSLELSLAMLMLVSARLLNIKIFKHKRVETKDVSFASMFSLSMLIAVFTAGLLDANCELPRSNTLNGAP
jgi:hypothetical protein